MPKEITHWLIAKQVAHALQGSRLGELVAAFPNCMHLGAILHDAGYYARDRRWKNLMSGFTESLHAEGAQTFTIINCLTEAANQSRNPDPIRAMIIGMLTHMAADSCFHPLIYHETGNYFDPDPVKRTRAVQLHRKFETTLDVYLAGTLANIKTFSLKHFMRCCELKVSTLLQDAFTKASNVFTCPQLPNALLHSLTIFSRMQGLYANPAVTNILESLHVFMPDAAREIAALFYMPGTVKQAPGLHGQRSIPEPETGNMRTVTILELYNNSIQSSLNLCRELEPALMGTAPLTVPGHSCNPDIPLPPKQQPGA
jgi:hypothetical protein